MLIGLPSECFASVEFNELPTSTSELLSGTKLALCIEMAVASFFASRFAEEFLVDLFMSTLIMFAD
jgi:hypothetical protein